MNEIDMGNKGSKGRKSGEKKSKRKRKEPLETLEKENVGDTTELNISGTILKRRSTEEARLNNSAANAPTAAQLQTQTPATEGGAQPPAPPTTTTTTTATTPTTGENNDLPTISAASEPAKTTTTTPTTSENNDLPTITPTASEPAKTTTTTTKTTSTTEKKRENLSNSKKREVKKIIPEPESDSEVEDDDNNDDDDDSVMIDTDNEEAGWLDEVDDMAGVTEVKSHALTTSGIMEAKTMKINEVCEFLCIEPYESQVLLQHFKWDKDILLERYLANADKVCKEAGVNLHKSKNKPKITQITCTICYDDVTEKEGFTGLSCEHYFCNNCWKMNLETQIKEGKSYEISCMHKGCNILVPDFVVQKSATFKKYCQFASKSFVENSNMKWCPKPGCSNAVSEYTSEGKCLVAKCSCGYKFCWLCNDEAHTPAICDLVKTWKKKCEDDSETYNWIQLNTKPCPKCHVSIEKNDGCFQMTCRNCKFQWCWLCQEDWKSHADHFSCTRYKGQKLQNKPEWMDGKAASDAQKEALDRYLHYYNRYINHYNSLKFEDNSRKKMVDKMNELQNQDNDNFYYNVNFILEAHEQLYDCRRTLKWTYVWAYYEEDMIKKDLFEFGQSSLEYITEKLAQLLEQPVAKITNTEVQHLTKVAKQSLHKLFLTDRD